MAFERDVVVIGASAGGVEALCQTVRSLSDEFPAAVLVVMHLSPGATTALPQILTRAGPLRAVQATHAAPLTRGVIHVAPPDHHLLIDGGALMLSHGPTENGHRPAINATFRSAAVAAGPRAIGVILSGALHDGAAGLGAVVERGGLAMVQDPADALYPGMPESALACVSTEHVYPADVLGKVLDHVVRTAASTRPVEPPSPALLLEDRIARDGVRVSPAATSAPTGNARPPPKRCAGSCCPSPPRPRHTRERRRRPTAGTAVPARVAVGVPEHTEDRHRAGREHDRAHDIAPAASARAAGRCLHRRRDFPGPGVQPVLDRGRGRPGRARAARPIPPRVRRVACGA
ncbi:CheB methylesterase [Amycolatopsis mediterranei S699]|uniref:protein-glutamate methylesterase n=2 Tax=Amycolatopsis mediterranei TaxID=33910 RepID=A0A0H3D545_AMYMU|nr:chemotaxis protein CheB [Amycolatopsis mediterranei]ADJ45377.1 CheB methylesterase [Amycolatopsis mediterranei U32]AEK42138.1 CheB methylesterase [Amycolatopsis mediterranei S699]AFO77088.1 CheB methylesterase [Amycolatopsis mediterranei S699]AGT84216.1 CheB methylesterase [Amycolatopsis mediterranei RB]UZF76146.1 chemotaxis protein CheB [Amycolatopsis mediterranei]